MAKSSDRDVIHRVHWSAFDEDEREIVSKLAVDLLSEATLPPTMSLVAETEGAVVGHVAFSPVAADGVDGFQGYVLAPLAVLPEYQRRHIGSLLVEDGIRQLSELGVDLLFVYGDPDYYGRFGFRADVAEGCAPPYEMEYPFGWQGLVLSQRGIPEPPLELSCVTSLCDPALW